MAESVLAVLQIVSIVLAGLFGVVGLLTKYRDDEGRMTRWGRLALVGVIVSTAVAASSQGLEILRRNREAIVAAERATAEAQRATKLMSELSRAVYPLRDVSLASTTIIPLNHPKLASYKKQLARQVRAIRSQWTGNPFAPPKSCRPPACLIGRRQPVESGDVFATTETVSFGSKSPLFPNPRRESLAELLIANVVVGMALYKEPTDPANFDTFWWKRGDRSADLRLEVDLEKTEEEVNLTYELGTNTLSAVLIAKADPRYASSTGRIVSMPDLLGAQMIAFFRPARRSSHDQLNKDLNELRREFRLRWLHLRISDRDFVFRSGQELQTYTSRNGEPIYVYRFPNTAEDLLRIQAP